MVSCGKHRCSDVIFFRQFTWDSSETSNTTSIPKRMVWASFSTRQLNPSRWVLAEMWVMVWLLNCQTWVAPWVVSLVAHSVVFLHLVSPHPLRELLVLPSATHWDKRFNIPFQNSRRVDRRVLEPALSWCIQTNMFCPPMLARQWHKRQLSRATSDERESN